MRGTAGAPGTAAGQERAADSAHPLPNVVPNEIDIDKHIPFTGQSAGLIGEILPARDIVQRLIVQATEALQSTSRLYG